MDCWKEGDKARHKEAEGLVIEIVEIKDEAHVRARIVQQGETTLSPRWLHTFRVELLEPAV